MEHDDEVGEVDSTDPGEASDGPRRSTFTPPTAPQPVTPWSGATDDDALADALAADLERVMSGPITVITPDTVVPPGPAMGPITPAAPVSWQPTNEVPPVAPAGLFIAK